ncbi:MAG: hypothetical protein SFW66_04940 [Gammaproteobacteria bacterium]|nr:hypothetical protein [Gammaproteobacteria bacterium]
MTINENHNIHKSLSLESLLKGPENRLETQFKIFTNIITVDPVTSHTEIKRPLSLHYTVKSEGIPCDCSKWYCLKETTSPLRANALHQPAVEQKAEDQSIMTEKQLNRLVI